VRILGVTLRDYRGTIERSVGFAPSGVTIVEGPNEVGKSSIPEAIDHVLDDLDSSGRRELQAVRPVDRDVGPEVAIEVETGDYAFTLRKRFLRQPITELQVHGPRPEHLTGRAAHDRVQQMLDETVDTALWKALRVLQGDIVGQARIGRGTSLAQALERSAGEVAPAGQGEETLLDAAHAEYLRFWTETGRRRQEEIALERTIVEASATVDRIARAIEDIEADVESSLDLGTESRRLTERRAGLRTRVEELQAHVDELAAIETGVVAAEARHDAARLAAEAAQKATDERRAVVLALEGARRTQEGLESGMAQDADQLEALRTRVAAAERALDDARVDRDRAAACADAVRARAEHARAAAELADLEDRYARGRAANAAMVAAAPDAALPVTTELVRAIREANRAVELARARLEAARPHIRIDARAPLEATIAGQPIRLAPGERAERRLDHDLSIDLPGVAAIRVTAGATLDQQGTVLADAETRLAALLSSAGVADLAAAEEQHARREAAARTAADHRRIRDLALQGATAKELAARILALRERLATDAPVADPHPGIDPDAAQRDLATAEQALRVAEQAWQEGSRELMATEVAVGRRETEARLAAEDVARRRSDLEAARATTPDEDLARRLADAEVAERQAATELASGREELARQGVETLRQELIEAKRALESIDVETRLVQDRLLEVTTRLRAHGEDGLAEELVEEEARRDHAAAELRRYQAQAAARRLLYETLRDERDRARRSYVAPLRREIERLGRTVFGAGFSVELDEKTLEVTSRTLDGRTIPYRSLSVGAQEQIAIIGRLACATIVAPDGGVPVILDDALGNSDPVRLAAMGEVLAAAGEQSQIIVLTCQPDRYDHLRAAKVVRLL
jgi:uncharacterized protein YhaN